MAEKRTNLGTTVRARLLNQSPLPLNIGCKPCASFIASLSALAIVVKLRAETMPLIGDSGRPRRAIEILR